MLSAAAALLAACATVRPEYATQAPVHRRGKPPSAPGLKGTDKPYQVGGVWYVPKAQPHYNETGVASWYGDAFHLKPTADGEIFDKDRPSAAHTTLPLPSLVEVTNLDNGKKLVVRVNDRGPFVDNRIIDLSHEAARQLGYDRKGLAHVRVRYLGPAPALDPESRRYAYLGTPAPASTAAPAPLDKPPATIVEASLAPPF
ncbi:septal ring lytic transglycosylase RlpA family protein [Phenylobacterium sp.]|uniref:septal ring lytic transglycosylase RlpA family protein n=1 Tax=Phenylobacterium sp. TaxID=1871053 RepID=UPI002DF4057A|nr:septal ring lytic transglycosylase RlpA family protein [Phenylobacterium sp.]